MGAANEVAVEVVVEVVVEIATASAPGFHGVALLVAAFCGSPWNVQRKTWKVHGGPWSVRGCPWKAVDMAVECR